MKTKFGKLLRVFEVDVLLIGLFEKLALWLIKKLERRLERLFRSLEKARQYRNAYTESSCSATLAEETSA